MKACIFDLDGVLVDTAKYHFIAWRNLAKKIGVEFSEADNEQLKGLSRDASLEYILKKGNVVSTIDQREEWKEEKNNEYLELVLQMKQDELLPNVLGLLDELRSNNIKIGLGSASKNAELILERVGIKHFFNVIIDGTKTSRSKPDPEVFLLGAKALQVLPSESVVFEDAISGIAAAKSGGFFAIGIGNKDVLSDADVVFPNLMNVNMNTIKKYFNN